MAISTYMPILSIIISVIIVILTIYQIRKNTHNRLHDKINECIENIQRMFNDSTTYPIGRIPNEIDNLQKLLTTIKETKKDQVITTLNTLIKQPSIEQYLINKECSNNKHDITKAKTQIEEALHLLQHIRIK